MQLCAKLIYCRVEITVIPPFKTIALIPAAGAGTRMGASTNKQYLDLCGVPIVARTIAMFESSPHIDAIFLVTPVDEIPYCQEHIVDFYRFTKVFAIVAGGTERQRSVLNGLNAMAPHTSPDTVVLIHDGVRPFLTNDMIEDSISQALIHDGVVVAVPVKDTIKCVCKGIIQSTPPRESLWQAQTPQTFRFKTIHGAHLSAATDSFSCTDDASLIERSGGQVQILKGEYRNIKNTTPEDLILAEAFLQESERKEERCRFR